MLNIIRLVEIWMHARLLFEFDDGVFYWDACSVALKHFMLHVLFLELFLFSAVRLACQLQVDSLGVFREEGCLEQVLEVFLCDLTQHFNLPRMPL